MVNSVAFKDGIVTFLENYIVKFPTEFTFEIVISIGGSVGFHTTAADDLVSFISFGSAIAKMRLIFKGSTLPRIAFATVLEYTGKTASSFLAFRSIVISVDESKI